jgi:ABC-type anion transport system duplicated permease subunit
MPNEADQSFHKVMGMLVHWRELRGRAAQGDYRLIQVVVLSAQISSLLASVLVAFSKEWNELARLMVALLAAFPAFCLSLERAFNFPLRRRLNGEAHYKFQSLILAQ